MPQKKFSDEFRLKVVQEYLSGKSGGLPAVAHKNGIDVSQLRAWVLLYQNHGVEGLCCCHRTYSGEFKVHVVEYMHENKLSFTKTAGYFCLPGQTVVARWDKIYHEEGRAALLKERRGRKRMSKEKTTKAKKKVKVNENEELLAEVKRLRMENEYLKKLNALVQEREKSKQRKK